MWSPVSENGPRGVYDLESYTSSSELRLKNQIDSFLHLGYSLWNMTMKTYNEGCLKKKKKENIFVLKYNQ